MTRAMVSKLASPPRAIPVDRAKAGCPQIEETRAQANRGVNGAMVGGWGISALAHIVFFVALGIMLIPLAPGSSQLVMRAVFQDQTEQLELRIPPNPSSMAMPDVASGRPAAPRGGVTISAISVHLDESLGQAGAGTGPGTGTSTGSDTGTGQATFFGSTAYGNNFVYVLDISSSMTKQSFVPGLRREQRAKQELVRSIEQLTDQQSFYVFLFSTDTQYMFGRQVAFPQVIQATEANKRRTKAWLEQAAIGGTTDPRKAIRTAMRMEPHAVFLLSDGEFNKNGGRQRLANLEVLELVESSTSTPVPVHTVAFEDPINERVLSHIARVTQGSHRFVGMPDSDNARADAFLQLADSLDRRAHPEAIDLYCRVAEEYPGTKQAVEADARLELILSPADDSDLKVGYVARHMLAFAKQREEEGHEQYAVERYRFIADRFPRTIAGRTAAARLKKLGGG